MDRSVTLQDLEKDLAVLENRTGRKGPLKTEIPVERNDINGPKFVPGEVITSQRAVSKEEDHLVSIRGRGGGREVASFIEGNSGKALPPLFLPGLPIQTQRYGATVPICGGEEYGIAPNHRR
jgi:hypothetical protein